MSGLLDNVDQRTNLVGQNRLELLTFYLNGSQMFALNVFKVREVMSLPKVNKLPESHPAIVGVTTLRGKTIPVIDLGYAIGRRPLRDDEEHNIIVTEYNQTIQAFLIGKVSHIINMAWDTILAPPRTAGRHHYLTALTRVDGKIVEIIDVEKVLAEISPYETSVSPGVVDDEVRNLSAGLTLMAVDDSPVALAHIKDTISHLGIRVVTESNGRRALLRLKQMAAEGLDVPQQYFMIITDAEMPEMDGYTLTAEVRQDPMLRDLYIVMHTSLSGSFNQQMVQRVGCNDFMSKFEPDRLAHCVQNRARQFLGI